MSRHPMILQARNSFLKMIPLIIAGISTSHAQEQHLYACVDAKELVELRMDGTSRVYAEFKGAKRGIDVDEDGVLWVAGTSSLYRVDRHENETPASIENGGVKEFATGLRSCLGMAIDPNGDFWIAEHHDGVVKIERETGNKTRIKVNGGAYSVERGPNGRMYVSRQSGQTVFEFMPDGTPTRGTKDAPEPLIAGYGNGHRSIVFDVNGDILLLYGKEIARFGPDGQYLGTFFDWDGEPAHGGTMTRDEFIARGIWHPMDLAVAQDGTVFSSDNGYNKKEGEKVGGGIYRYKPDGTRELIFETQTRVNWMTFWPRTKVTSANSQE